MNANEKLSTIALLAASHTLRPVILAIIPERGACSETGALFVVARIVKGSRPEVVVWRWLPPDDNEPCGSFEFGNYTPDLQTAMPVALVRAGWA